MSRMVSGSTGARRSTPRISAPMCLDSGMTSSRVRVATFMTEPRSRAGDVETELTRPYLPQQRQDITQQHCGGGHGYGKASARGWPQSRSAGGWEHRGSSDLLWPAVRLRAAWEKQQFRVHRFGRPVHRVAEGTYPASRWRAPLWAGVDDKEAVRKALAEAGIKTLPGRF